MADIKAVQTFYNGTYYRSRTEARWALFLDVLGVAFDYEPEKFELPSGRYIPDFMVNLGCKQAQTFIEIKGAQPTKDVIDRFSEFGCYVARPYLISGTAKHYRIDDQFSEAAGYRWMQCPFCGALDIIVNLQERYHHLEGFQCREREEILRTYDIQEFFFALPPVDSPCIKIATSAAMSARFEDGSILAVVEAQKQACKTLKDGGIFCAPNTWQRINRECLKLSRGMCPNFTGDFPRTDDGERVKRETSLDVQ